MLWEGGTKMQNTDKKILVLGSTGAMAVYLIPELLKKGYSVVGVSLDDAKSDNEKLTYIKADAKDFDFLTKLLESGFDAIVDFMVYNKLEIFEKYYNLFIKNTNHYIFLSSYRVYADDSPLSETSKRLLDVEKPADFVTELEYSIYKAEEEDFINNSDYKNYTILRPAITYSKRRFQLVTLEADVLVWRMLQGKTVVLPKSAMEKEATMTWAGDVAKMIASLVLNPEAYGETYNVSTSEHRKWKDVAKIYEKIANLKYIIADDRDYIDILGYDFAKQQLFYDRCFDRVVDNSKILSICNMNREELMSLEEGLSMEYKNISLDQVRCNLPINERMDKYLERTGVEKH